MEVEVSGEFPAEGEPAARIEYGAKVRGGAPEFLDLMAWTDRVSEIQNTIRRGVAVTMMRAEAMQTG